MTKAGRRLVAGSEILGGALLMANIVWQEHLGASLPWWFIGIGEVVGSCSIAAGFLLWRDHSFGRPISFIVQLLQILQVQAPRFGYLFIAGVQVSVTVPPSPYLLHAGFFGSLSVRLNPASPLVIGVNLFSLCAALVIMTRGHATDAKSLGSEVLSKSV